MKKIVVNNQLGSQSQTMMAEALAMLAFFCNESNVSCYISLLKGSTALTFEIKSFEYADDKNTSVYRPDMERAFCKMFLGKAIKERKVFVFDKVMSNKGSKWV